MSGDHPWLNGFCWTHRLNFNLYEGKDCPECRAEGKKTPHALTGVANPSAPSKSDERDAEAWAESMEPTNHEAPVGERVPIRQVWLYRGFLAGRKGMVPAAEVKRLKTLVRNLEAKIKRMEEPK